jgi:hypothetical protein
MAKYKPRYVVISRLGFCFGVFPKTVAGLKSARKYTRKLRAESNDRFTIVPDGPKKKSASR